MGRVSHCKPCAQIKKRQSPNFKKTQARANRKRTVARKQFINEAKPPICPLCLGKYPPFCMDFHHKDPSTKVQVVSKMARGYSFESY